MTFNESVFKLYKNWVEVGKAFGYYDKALTPEIFVEKFAKCIRDRLSAEESDKKEKSV